MKKKKRVLTKQQRNAILQSLGRANDSTFVVNNNEPKPHVNQSNPVTVNTNNIFTGQIQIDSVSIINEIKKIAIVGGIIVALLIGIIIINQKTDYILKVGSIITQNVGL